jgi:hypothetical protein
MSVCPSARTELLGSHWVDFHEIRYLSIFLKSVDKGESSLKSYKNNEYFTWGFMYICDNVFISLLMMRSASGEGCVENQNIFYVQ